MSAADHPGAPDPGERHDRPGIGHPGPDAPEPITFEPAAPDPVVSRPGDGAPRISVVVPMRDEGPNVAPLVAEIVAALVGTPHEIVCVDDGSIDDTFARLAEAAAALPAGSSLVPLRHAASCGQSAALVTAVRAARAPWIATLDGDGQNDPADIPRLWARARAENLAAELRAGTGATGRSVAATSANARPHAEDPYGADAGPCVLVAGWRVARRDTRTKRLTSRIANGVRARLLGDATPDTGCGLKVMPRAAFLELPAFDHMHRFLPALVIRNGGRVVSEPVNHRPRLRGRSNYGTLDRLAVGLVDLLGVMWLQRRWKRPGRTS